MTSNLPSHVFCISFSSADSPNFYIFLVMSLKALPAVLHLAVSANSRISVRVMGEIWKIAPHINSISQKKCLPWVSEYRSFAQSPPAHSLVMPLKYFLPSDKPDVKSCLSNLHL